MHIYKRCPQHMAELSRKFIPDTILHDLNKRKTHAAGLVAAVREGVALFRLAWVCLFDGLV